MKIRVVDESHDLVFTEESGWLRRVRKHVYIVRRNGDVWRRLTKSEAVAVRRALDEYRSMPVRPIDIRTHPRKGP
jgi:hypothetical protein